MRIINLTVHNFRAISRIEMSDLEDMIVIAGPNGCGKSCVLDAIRLFKSVYGGYQPNEWQQWMSEFQINHREPHRMASLLREKHESSIVEAQIELVEEERRFIEANLDILLEDLAWRAVVPGFERWRGSANSLAMELRSHEAKVKQHVSELRPSVLELLNSRLLTGRLSIRPDGQAVTYNNVLLELVFSLFHPGHIGVIDFHGAHRNYVREELGGINLNFDQEADRLKNTSLYNAANKYSNVKSEMAAEYIKQVLISRGANGSNSPQSLADSMHELFGIFFPGKRFGGPVPTNDGNLSFPVQMEGGVDHDINDLSSGEKEIMFGYLRMRNSAPGHSIILVDEPELHLNPALIRGLPRFYRHRLGMELDNQIWLVTHSDAFLREALGQDRLQIFHLRHATAVRQSENQIQSVGQEHEVDAVILEMVGNLATYTPGAKIVFFEGENSEFDLHMVSRLFPTIENELNLVSAGNRLRVERLHETLEKGLTAGNIPIRIYSVVDKDSGPLHEGVYDRHYTWDLYHIENYLLEPRFVDEALGRLRVSHTELSSLGKIDDCLRDIAREQISKLIIHELTSEAHARLRGDLQLKANPMSSEIGSDFHASMAGSIGRMNERLANDLSVEEIQARVARDEKTLTASLESDQWKEHFRGRDVLKAFVGRFVPGMRYEYFRDLIVSQMVSDGYEPPGMKSILEQIQAD